MLILDTNVYLDALRDTDRQKLVGTIIEQTGDALGLHSVVVAEILAGGSGPGARAGYIDRVRRMATGVITPTHDDWAFAGNAVRVLGGDAVTTRRSFWNDMLIATSCARVGATLLTSNKDDFARIRRAVPVEIVVLPN